MKRVLLFATVAIFSVACAGNSSDNKAEVQSVEMESQTVALSDTTHVEPIPITDLSANKVRREPVTRVPKPGKMSQE